jgi:uncharacterized protein
MKTSGESQRQKNLAATIFFSKRYHPHGLVDIIKKSGITMKNVALISGGTTGFGLALAEEFASHGHDLVLLARSQPELFATAQAIEKTYSVEVEVFARDLREAGAARDVYDFCQKQGIRVETLVNNVGGGTYGPFADTYIDDNEATVQLDVVFLIDLTYLFLHDMIAAKHGYVLNVSSTAGFQPGPNMAVYYASKAFVTSFSESLTMELRGKGVTVTCLCPGPMKTPMLRQSGIDKSHIVKIFKPMDPAVVAKIAYAGMMKKKVIIVPGGKNWRRVVAVRFFPRAIVRRQMVAITRPLKEPKK